MAESVRHDKAEKGEVPGAVYAVGCKECKKVYIGETKRTANQRIREHKADTRIGRVDKSGTADHAPGGWTRGTLGAMIVEKEQRSGRRKVKEALHIHHMKKAGGSMYRDKGSHLSKIWLDLVK